jgi:hypothetical protein
MKAFRVLCVNNHPLSGGPRWIVQVVEDGGDFKAVEPVRLYHTEAEAATERDHLDAEENSSLR